MSRMSPRVFVSYTHDSAAHMERVLALAQELRRQGVQSELDQFLDSPPEGWPRWMSREIGEADFVLLVCTDRYRRRFEGSEVPGCGLGARWEGFLTTQDLYDAGARNERFVPLLFDGDDEIHIPRELRAATYYRVPSQFESLYRRLTGQSAIVPAPVGPVRLMPPRDPHLPGEPAVLPDLHTAAAPIGVRHHLRALGIVASLVLASATLAVAARWHRAAVPQAPVCALGEPSGLGRLIELAVSEQRYDDALACLDPLRAHDGDGSAYLVYPDLALALDRTGRPDRAVELLLALRARILEDAVKRSGLFSSEKELVAVALKLQTLAPRLASPEVRRVAEDLIGATLEIAKNIPFPTVALIKAGAPSEPRSLSTAEVLALREYARSSVQAGRYADALRCYEPLRDGGDEASLAVFPWLARAFSLTGDRAHAVEALDAVRAAIERDAAEGKGYFHAPDRIAAVKRALEATRDAAAPAEVIAAHRELADAVALRLPAITLPPKGEIE